jgi:hypothetical protein
MRARLLIQRINKRTGPADSDCQALDIAALSNGSPLIELVLRVCLLKSPAAGTRVKANAMLIKPRHGVRAGLGRWSWSPAMVAYFGRRLGRYTEGSIALD